MLYYRGLKVWEKVPLETVLYNGQQINRGTVTAFSDHTVVPESRVTPIRKDTPLPSVALVGRAAATGMGMTFNNA